MRFDEERDLARSRRANLDNWRLRCTYDQCTEMFTAGDKLEAVLAHTRGAHNQETPRFELVWAGEGPPPPPTRNNGH